MRFWLKTTFLQVALKISTKGVVMKDQRLLCLLKVAKLNIA